MKWNAAREAPAAILLEKTNKITVERKLTELEMSERNYTILAEENLMYRAK